MVQIYTGDGKGKSTAAFGLALRAAGAGRRVSIVQFCKKSGCSEHKAFDRLGVEVISGAQIELPPWDKNSEAAWKEHSQEQFTLALQLFADRDILILDEILYACSRGFISEGQLKDLIAGRPESLELVLTGRNAPAFALELADLVTEMKCVKHYYKKGVEAREGIEY